MTITHPPRIIAITVTFHPNLDLLSQQIALLTPQVSEIVIVDNGSSADLNDWNLQRQQKVSEIILLKENLGIAAAHNKGIEWAKSRGADYVLLMDQDSLPAADMVDKLTAVILHQTKPASVGPRYFDARQNNPPPFIRVRGGRLVRCACEAPNSVVEVDYLISSGCLIPMTVLDKVGVMRDDLFIDYVDIEWGLRANQHGFQSYGVCAARMQHNLGENPIKFFGKNVPLHSPLRHYYQFRNAVLLYNDSNIPFGWKFVDGRRLILRYVFYALFAKPHLPHWHMMTLGLWHGLLNKAGKFKNT